MRQGGNGSGAHRESYGVNDKLEVASDAANRRWRRSVAGGEDDADGSAAGRLRSILLA